MGIKKKLNLGLRVGGSLAALIFSCALPSCQQESSFKSPENKISSTRTRDESDLAEEEACNRADSLITKIPQEFEKFSRNGYLMYHDRELKPGAGIYQGMPLRKFSGKGRMAIVDQDKDVTMGYLNYTEITPENVQELTEKVWMLQIKKEIIRMSIKNQSVFYSIQGGKWVRWSASTQNTKSIEQSMEIDDYVAPSYSEKPVPVSLPLKKSEATKENVRRYKDLADKVKKLYSP
ncbi:MAG: hypothetical protein KKB21_02235 [Nanoarchaeota archaeon]|nr:hypothetical protein [Nanoarchaeota archaeon]MBU4086374.1 hypothetical protein [Nanoarchaeota archaeon]